MNVKCIKNNFIFYLFVSDTPADIVSRVHLGTFTTTNKHTNLLSCIVINTTIAMKHVQISSEVRQ